MLVVGIILVLITSIHTVLEIRHAIKNHKFGIFHYVIAWFIFIYGLVPLCLYANRNFVSTPFRSYWESLHCYLGYILCFYCLTYIFLYAGFKFSKGSSYQITINNVNKTSTISFWLLIIGASALVISIRGYGGLSFYMNHVSAIRSGTAENKSYLYSFIGIFSVYLLYAFILSLAVLLQRSNRRTKIKSSIIFVLSIAPLLIRMFLSGGRATMISLFVLILILLLLQKGKLPILLTAVSMISILFIVFYGKIYIATIFSDNKMAFYDIAYQGGNTYVEAFIQEFSHQTMSQVVSLQGDLLGDRLLKDYFIWILKPVRLFISDPYFDSISYYNTYQVLGEWDSNIPPGFIGLALYNGGLILLVMQAIVFGMVLRKIDSLFFNSVIQSNALCMCIYLFLFDLSWYALQNGDPAIIIQASIPFILFICFLVTTRIVSIRKPIKQNTK